MKLWQKASKLNKEVEEFTAGEDVVLDMQLLEYDCDASIAHAAMLKKIKILTRREFKSLKGALEEIKKLDKKGKFKIKVEDEDAHTAIENYLVKKLGTTGKKIHTGRSRNDQVLVAIRLYTKNHLLKTMKQTKECISLLKMLEKAHMETLMPGYTHMQRAMPSTFGLWAGAFAESFEDDIKILEAAHKVLDQNPLGSAAGYPIMLKLDRVLTTKLLGFKKTQKNTLYCQNSRGKLEALAVGALLQVMLDLNKMATDLLLFSTHEFGFVELPQELCTGSSIMPQKKNADIFELVRAKLGVVSSNYSRILAVIGNLPSGFNRDFQETKKPLFESFDTTTKCLKIMSLALGKIKVNKAKMAAAVSPEMHSANNALKLAEKGIAFRDAYMKQKV